jgi:hypothetical protein
MSTPITTLGFAPTIEVGFAPSAFVIKVSFTLVDRISFTLGFVFAKKHFMTDLTITCNYSMHRTMVASRTFSTWLVIYGNCVSIA